MYEASFASERFANYRAYKMEFVAQPISDPIAKAFASANSRGHLRTSIYVSWNGATEVTLWRFYSHTATHGIESVAYIGETPKVGFETAFLAEGYHPIVFAEAVDAYSQSLANSSLEITELPMGFYDPSSPMLSRTQQAKSGRRYALMKTVNLGDMANDVRNTAPSDLFMHSIVAFVAGIALSTIWNRFQNGRHIFDRRRWSLRLAHKGD